MKVGGRSLELISFRLCPFVQRAMVLLSFKGVDYRSSFVNLGDPPEWFREISPLGKVPVLRVDGKISIFESAVICEYLDETTPPPLMPQDPLQRARNRSWIEYATTALMPLRDLTTVGTAVGLDETVTGFQARLEPLEQAIGGGPYFNGNAFSLVDASYAPLFLRMDYFDRLVADMMPPARYPRLKAWRSALSTLPAVRDTIGEDFSKLMDDLVAKRRGYLASLLPDEFKHDGPRREY